LARFFCEREKERKEPNLKEKQKKGKDQKKKSDVVCRWMNDELKDLLSLCLSYRE